MKQLFFPFVICFFVLTACTSPGEKITIVSENDTLKKVADTAKIIPTTSGDTFKIMMPEIIFSNPNDAEITKMMAEDSDGYNSTVDDVAYYNSQLIERADSLNIKSESTEARILDFVTDNKKQIFIDKSKLKDMEFVTYLFNGTDSPKVADIDMDKAFLKTYFKK